MVRDYSQFLPSTSGAKTEAEPDAMRSLGWRPFFAQQTSVEDLAELTPVRVVEVHRTGFHVLGDGLDQMVPPGLPATVGDWLMLDRAGTPLRLLERLSLFLRRAPGTGREAQLIAANVDTGFIVTSCNQDFNVARLERYLALAFEAGVTPVILLTKADLVDDADTFETRARAISDRAEVVALNALSADPVTKLAPWCRRGQTVAFLGSSGVGKSTLVNALLEGEATDTAAIREDDSKGRHTTTRRQMFFTESGAAILDTPGMRELQMTDVEDGISQVFSDLAELATACKFNDCAHETEPGCAVRAAIDAGEIDASRLARWKKLMAEERFNTATLAERRAGEKAFQKRVNAATRHSRK